MDGVDVVTQLRSVPPGRPEVGHSTKSTPSTKSTYYRPASPQHQFRDLQGIKGSSFQELVAADPER